MTASIGGVGPQWVWVSEVLSLIDQRMMVMGISRG